MIYKLCVPGSGAIKLTLARGGIMPASAMQLQAGESVSAAERESIRSGIGGLAYLSYFRFDVAQVFSRLGRVQADPPREAGAVLDHVVQALLETEDDVWTVGAPGINTFVIMADTPPFSRDANGNYIKNFGGHIISDANLENPVCSTIESSVSGARSMLCHAVMLGGAAVDFSASRAATMAADTTVAELLAMVNGLTKGLMCRRLLVSLGFGDACDGAWPVWSDCAGAINVCTNTTAPKRSLWVGRRARLGQELVEGGDFQPKHCDGKLNPCDSGTKRTPTRQAVRDMGYLMGSGTDEWDNPPGAKLFSTAAHNSEPASAALASATLRENAEFEALAAVSPALDDEGCSALGGEALAVDDDDFFLAPDDAVHAEALAHHLNAAIEDDGDSGMRLLACYAREEEHILLAVQANGSVALLTDNGTVAVQEPKNYREAMRSATYGPQRRSR